MTHRPTPIDPFAIWGAISVREARALACESPSEAHALGREYRRLHALADKLASRSEMQSEWAAQGITPAVAGARLRAYLESRADELAPRPKLGDLIRELTPAEIAERDRATHRLDGRRYEELRPAEKHQLMLDDRERYLAMRRDWEARGKPLAGERRPVDLIGALKETAKLCGIDWNAPPPRRHLEVVT